MSSGSGVFLVVLVNEFWSGVLLRLAHAGRAFAGCGHGGIPRRASGRSAARLRCPSPGSSRPT